MDRAVDRWQENSKLCLLQCYLYLYTLPSGGKWREMEKFEVGGMRVATTYLAAALSFWFLLHTHQNNSRAKKLQDGNCINSLSVPIHCSIKCSPKQVVRGPCPFFQVVLPALTSSLGFSHITSPWYSSPATDRLTPDWMRGHNGRKNSWISKFYEPFVRRDPTILWEHISFLW